MLDPSLRVNERFGYQALAPINADVLASHIRLAANSRRSANRRLRSAIRRRSSHSDLPPEPLKRRQDEILRAIPSATPAGFLSLARYACYLTVEDEGDAVEGASYAYMLSLLWPAGRCSVRRSMTWTARKPEPWLCRAS